MNMHWDTPEPPEEPLPSPPPVWIYIVALLVLVLVAAAITVINWPKDKSSMTGEFFAYIFLLPVLPWLFVCAVIYRLAYEYVFFQVVTWNFERWRFLVGRQRWARQNLLILDSSYLTPETELAERMLGLEGTKPMNPDKVMALPNVDSGIEDSRLATVLETLLAPLVGLVSSVTPQGTFDIVMQSPMIGNEIDLRRVWSRLQLAGTPQISWSEYSSAFPAEQWIDSPKTPDFRLVIAWQLHESDDEPSFSEAAVALLLAEPAAVERWKGKLRPQACLYRPIVAEADAISTDLTHLLGGQQVPKDRIKHFWLSRLNRTARHGSKEAIKDSGLPAVEHDVDHAIGKPGPVNTWLLQALAAEMVQHGQGAQLVAVPAGPGVSFNLVGSRPEPLSVPFDKRLDHLLVSIPTMVGVIAFVVFLFCLPGGANADTTTVLVAAVITLLLILVIVGADYITRIRIEEQFWRRYGDLG